MNKFNLKKPVFSLNTTSGERETEINSIRLGYDKIQNLTTQQQWDLLNSMRANYIGWFFEQTRNSHGYYPLISNRSILLKNIGPEGVLALAHMPDLLLRDTFDIFREFCYINSLHHPIQFTPDPCLDGVDHPQLWYQSFFSCQNQPLLFLKYLSQNNPKLAGYLHYIATSNALGCYGFLALMPILQFLPVIFSDSAYTFDITQKFIEDLQGCQHVEQQMNWVTDTYSKRFLNLVDTVCNDLKLWEYNYVAVAKNLAFKLCDLFGTDCGVDITEIEVPKPLIDKTVKIKSTLLDVNSGLIWITIFAGVAGTVIVFTVEVLKNTH
jgi:hypothetical protein